MARGPSIVEGVRPNELSILDVAPLLLYSLDLPIPGDMEGRLPNEILKTDALQVQPIRRVAADQMSTNQAPESSGSADFDAEAEEIMMKRLRALGYIE
jgi:hypothetical protein